MAPWYPDYNDDYYENKSPDHPDWGNDTNAGGVSKITLWYLMVLISIFLIWILIFFCLRIITLRQKTRNSQQRRTYMGSRQRPSVSQTEPTIYVSPANLPPPPKYEAMAPPSYEEVVGIHYPAYQPPIQPITQPISAALAQSSNSTDTTINNVTPNVTATNNVTPTSASNVTNNDTETPSTVITVTSDDNRKSVTVATS